MNCYSYSVSELVDGQDTRRREGIGGVERPYVAANNREDLRLCLGKLEGSSTMRPLNPDSAQRRSDSSEIKQALGIQIRLKPIGWQHTRRLTAEVMPGVGVLSLPLCKKVQQCSDSKDDRCPMSKRCADRSTNPNEQAAWTRPGLAGDGFGNGLGRGEISKRIRAALAVEWQRDAGSP